MPGLDQLSRRPVEAMMAVGRTVASPPCGHQQARVTKYTKTVTPPMAIPAACNSGQMLQLAGFRSRLSCST